ncbi:MAG: glycosyltransferase family 2 protein [Deltaproteobacteria bacterium]|nr:glycosyltransferase family 2 protein [Deltaproteobacteria bacterium]
MDGKFPWERPFSACRASNHPAKSRRIPALNEGDRTTREKDQMDLSVIVPVYGSERTLPELFARLKATLDTTGLRWEVIFVDDAGPDGSYRVLSGLKDAFHEIQVVRLDKNYGQHNATLCGYRHAKGRYVLAMDDDLQHPPEAIPRMLAKMREGYLVVMGAYRERRHPVLRGIASWILHCIFFRIWDVPKGIQVTSFRLVDRSVVDKVVQIYDTNVYLPGFIFRFVPKDAVANIEVAHQGRISGRSGYEVHKLWSLAEQMVMDCTCLPSVLFSVASVLLSLLVLGGVALLIVAKSSAGDQFPSDLFSALTGLFMFQGVILLVMSPIARYLKRAARRNRGEAQYMENKENG